MSLNKKVLSNVSSSNQSSGLSTAQLKQFIQNEVYDILGGIKQEIEIKMKQIDRNMIILKTQILSIKRNSSPGSNNPQTDLSNIEGPFKQLFLRVQIIQKDIIKIKNAQTINDYSFVTGDISRSNITNYKQNQSGGKNTSNEISRSNITNYKQNQSGGKNTSNEKNTPNEKIYSNEQNNSPLFKKSYHQSVDLASLIFQDQKQVKTKNQVYQNLASQNNTLKNERKTNIFSNSGQNLKKPPLPNLDKKAQYSTASDFYKTESPQNSYSRNNQIMNSTQNVFGQKVESQLGKNKNVFLRRKKSEQKIDEPVIDTRPTYHRFENQEEDFSAKQDQSFNIQLEYSKDTFISDL